MFSTRPHRRDLIMFEPVGLPAHDMSGQGLLGAHDDHALTGAGILNECHLHLLPDSRKHV